MALLDRVREGWSHQRGNNSSIRKERMDKMGRLIALLKELRHSLATNHRSIGRKRASQDIDQVLVDLQSGQYQGLSANLMVKWFSNELRAQLHDNYIILTRDEELIRLEIEEISRQLDQEFTKNTGFISNLASILGRNSD